MSDTESLTDILFKPRFYKRDLGYVNLSSIVIPAGSFYYDSGKTIYFTKNDFRFGKLLQLERDVIVCKCRKIIHESNAATGEIASLLFFGLLREEKKEIKIIGTLQVDGVDINRIGGVDFTVDVSEFHPEAVQCEKVITLGLPK
jgi:hypothetical protein